ncbi:MAG: ABC transporter permease [Spirochaetota bacterium]
MGEALWEALGLIASGDRELLAITWNSIRYSVFSTALTSLLAIPTGVLLAFRRFSGRRAFISVLHTLMALPTVIVGLLVYSLLSRSGPLGALGILFTPSAIIVGQTVLAYPIVTSLVYGSVYAMEEELRETLTTLGCSGHQIVWKTLLEARVAVATAVLSGFGRLIGEVGVSMMLGGNIRWYTRTMTTAIALETQRGAFSLALALGLLLMIVAFGVNFILNWTAHRATA